MNWFTTSLRRALWLAALGAVSGTAYTWWRERQPGNDPINPPEWPPLGSSAPSADDNTAASTIIPPADVVNPRASGSSKAGTTRDVSALVNALVDTPDARSASTNGSWASPNDDGSCPDGFPIKANDNSGIYHLPTGRFYARTKAERCYATAEGAEADGYRAAKS